MEIAIFKFQIPVRKATILAMPKNPEFIKAKYFTDGIINIWALVNPENEYCARKLKIYATGEKTEENEKYIDTIFVPTTNEVYHLFDCGVQ